MLIDCGQPGETYNIGAGNEVRNIDLSHRILELLDRPASLVKPVTDRLGHDRRYALDTTRMRDLGWQPEVSFDEGLRETVAWYRNNQWWWRPIKEQDPAFRAYHAAQYDRQG
jgi:dTDP-glucose 4,6-dehydratase